MKVEIHLTEDEMQEIMVSNNIKDSQDLHSYFRIFNDMDEKDELNIRIEDVVNMFEVKNLDVFCNDCHDLCTLMTNQSSKMPVFCPKTSKKCNWKKVE
ncbi:MAG: hypothetical protein ACFE9L_09295 [Candidatus Hodarchaeota archaeon]